VEPWGNSPQSIFALDASAGAQAVGGVPVTVQALRGPRPPVRAAQLLSEGVLLEWVINEAHLRGWLVFHARPAREKGTYVTPTQGDTGFVDVVLAGHGRVLFRELKSEQGVLAADQCRWADALEAVGEPLEVMADHVSYGVWRPRDWFSGRIARELDVRGAEGRR
jgi:hypothetical protein